MLGECLSELLEVRELWRLGLRLGEGFGETSCGASTTALTLFERMQLHKLKPETF